MRLLLLLAFAGPAAAAPVPKPAPPDPDGHGYLGITFDESKPLGVGEVGDGTPAAAAGVRPGDVFVRVGDLTPTDRRELQLYVGNRRPGTVLSVVVRRGNAEATLAVTLGAMDPRAEPQFRALRANRPWPEP